MSFLTSRALRSIPRSTLPIRNNTRAFHLSVRRAALSESDHSEHDHDDRKAKIDHHKDDQLNKQKEGKGHWKPELSSNSEAAFKGVRVFGHELSWMDGLGWANVMLWNQIKADRDEINNVEDDISALQKETEQVMGKNEENKPK
ncbi:MAG: hypothetical protein Q9181_003759 [Wetmoreana brouardii]